jgi:hypothetical protein
MADCPCVLVTLPAEVPLVIILPDDPACCCDADPTPVQPGYFYDGFAFHNGVITYQ